MTGQRDWAAVAPQFRDRFIQSQGSMGTWDDAELAYRYGWEAASWPEYAGRSWLEVAPELERRWGEYQRRHGRRITTEWEGYRKAVQDAYESSMPSSGATASAPQRSATELVREFLDAYNSKGKASLDTIMGCLAPDAEVIFSPVSGPIRGERNLRAAFTGLFADEAGTQLEIERIIEEPDVVAAEWIERGRNYRTAEDVLRQVAGFFDIRNGRIARLRTYSVRVR